jgi:serine/threonine protein kinase
LAIVPLIRHQVSLHDLFVCPHCKKRLTVRDEFAGKTGKCPDCKQAATVPGRDKHRGESKPVATLPPNPESESRNPFAPGGNFKAVSGTTHGGHPLGAIPSEYYDFLAPAQGTGEIGRLGPYRVLEVLGAGGMGVVFQAEDLLLERKVALKAMLPSLAASESSRQRFLREAKAAAALGHDHIVRIYQVGEDRGVPYIAMEFLLGEALDERLKCQKRLLLPQILRIGRETALGLAAAHKHGLVHREIRPTNLWLEAETDRVKILACCTV